MFPFPQAAPYGGTGGMTANQMPQPMLQGLQQQMQPYMLSPNGTQQRLGGTSYGGAPQSTPQGPGAQASPSINPQQIAMLRGVIQRLEQQVPATNLRSLLGL